MAAAVLKNEPRAKQLLVEAQEFARALPQGSKLRKRFEFYQTLAKAGLEVGAADLDRDSLQTAVSAKQTQLRAVLTNARLTRPEREDLEFLYFVAQFLEQKGRIVGAVPKENGVAGKPLAVEIHDFMTTTNDS
jgi:hypothetical protein